MSTRSRVASTGALATLVLAWGGCNAILGNSDGVYVDAGDTASDAASSDGSPSDGAGDEARSDGGLADGRADACVADLTNDARNCGRCGHDCLLGACSQSECQPFVVVGDAAAPERMIVRGTTIYWSSEVSRTIDRVNQDGTAKEQLLSAALGPATAIAVDGSGLYYTATPTDGGNPELRQCPLTGPCAPVAIAQFAGPATDVVADGVNVYVASPPSKIFAVHESDHLNNPFVSGIVAIAQLATVSPFVYWSDSNNRVARVRADGSDGGFAVTTASSPTFLKVRGDRAAWGGFIVTTSSYGSCDVTNCAGTTVNLTRAAEQAADVDVDATTLYWITRGGGAANGTVQSCSFADACGSVSSHASGQAQPVAMAVTSQAIYWLNNQGGGVGAVMGVAK